MMDRMPSLSAIITYIASVFTVVMGELADMDLVTIVGITLGVGTFGVNWFYKHQQHKRDALRFKRELQGDDACSGS